MNDLKPHNEPAISGKMLMQTIPISADVLQQTSRSMIVSAHFIQTECNNVYIVPYGGQFIGNLDGVKRPRISISEFEKDYLYSSITETEKAKKALSALGFERFREVGSPSADFDAIAEKNISIVKKTKIGQFVVISYEIPVNEFAYSLKDKKISADEIIKAIIKSRKAGMLVEILTLSEFEKLHNTDSRKRYIQILQIF